MTDRPSSPADVTPVDRSSEPPIRDEMRRIQGSVDGLRQDIGRQFDAAGDLLLRRLRADAKENTDAIHTVFSKRLRIAIGAQRLLAERDRRRTEAKIEAVDHRVDELSLRTGVGLSSAETAIERLAKPVGYSAGGAGMIAAAQYLGPLLNPSLRELGDAIWSLFQ